MWLRFASLGFKKDQPHRNEASRTLYDGPSRLYAIVRDCIDAFAAQDLYESAIIFTGGYDGDRGGYGRRLRLSGNFSKEEILSAVLVGKDDTLIDLEYCKQLDEECLEAILFHTRSLKRMMLKGTQIGKHSNVIRNANVGRKEKIHFTFEDACKVSGRPSVLTQCNFHKNMLSDSAFLRFL